MADSKPRRKLGVTATRRGLTQKQYAVFKQTILQYQELHDGDCIGGDDQAFEIAWENNLYTVGHPPINPKNRAFNKHDEERPEKEYMERNRDIVDEVDVMIAGPRMFTEEVRGSGTWNAIRYTRKVGKPLIIVWPDGTTTQERFNATGADSTMSAVR